MSLVGFKAQNHVQQVRKGGPKDAVDDRGTDPELFAELSRMYGPFTLDVAASDRNAKCERYFTIEDDGLTQSWAGENVWCNPPYSGLDKWLEKAWREFYADPTTGITMLLPANRCEQKWWQDHVEPFRDGNGLYLRTYFLPGRPRFVMPGEEAIGPNQRPPFGCVLLVWGQVLD